jgi:hypothetical protein
MPDGVDHETFFGLLANPQRWTQGDRRTVEFALAQQRQLLQACHPNDRRRREMLVSIVEQIEAALATGSA